MTAGDTFQDAAAVFAALPGRLDPARVGSTRGVLVFTIRDAGTWTVHLDQGRATVSDGDDAAADVRVTTDESHWLAIAEGRATARRLFMQGKVRVQGRLQLAVQLDKLLGPAR